MYYLGIDGGTYKTKAVVGDDQGRIAGWGEGGPSNYQVCGLGIAMAGISQAVHGALGKAEISLNDISHATFGLSGMDLPMHREELERGLTTVFPSLSFELVNDTWIMLKGGTDHGWGIALVCGGGANACACSAHGSWVTLRGLGYESGMRGGGLDMLRDILHYAFLSHDGTGPRSVLEEAVLKATGASDYDALQLMLLQTMQDMTGNNELLHRALDVVPLVFQAATAGDAACKRILLAQAGSLAEGVTGLVHRMSFEHEAVDVVLGGSLFLGENPLLIDRLTLLVHREAPHAVLHRPFLDPVLGAYIMALERTGRNADRMLYETLARQPMP